MGDNEIIQTDNQCAHSHGLLSLVICSRPIHSPCRPSCCECTYRSVLICSNPDFGPPPSGEEKYWPAAQVTCRPLANSIASSRELRWNWTAVVPTHRKHSVSCWETKMRGVDSGLLVRYVSGFSVC